jgi:hypothetical protein
MQWLNHKVFIGFVVTGSHFFCSFHVYIDLVGSSINSWLILMIAAERYLSVTKPFLIRTRFNRKQAWLIVFSVFLVASIAPLGLAIVASTVNDCLLFFSKTYQIIGSIQIFFIYVLPSILILTLSIITVHKLRTRVRTRSSKRIQISVMLIAVSFSFITFTMPYQVCWYWLFSTAFGSVTLNLKVNIINIGFRYLALTIRNLNYTLNFFLYSLTSMIFLKEAFTIAHCNYFLSRTLVERNPAFRRVRRLFSEHIEQERQGMEHIEPIDGMRRTRAKSCSFSPTRALQCQKRSNSNLSMNDEQSTNAVHRQVNDTNKRMRTVSLKLRAIHSTTSNKICSWHVKPMPNIRPLPLKIQSDDQQQTLNSSIQQDTVQVQD